MDVAAVIVVVQAEVLVLTPMFALDQQRKGQSTKNIFSLLGECIRIMSPDSVLKQEACNSERAVLKGRFAE